MQASMLTRSVSKWQDIQIEGSESEGELGGEGEQGLGKECVCVSCEAFLSAPWTNVAPSLLCMTKGEKESTHGFKWVWK